MKSRISRWLCCLCLALFPAPTLAQAAGHTSPHATGATTQPGHVSSSRVETAKPENGKKEKPEGEKPHNEGMVEAIVAVLGLVGIIITFFLTRWQVSKELEEKFNAELRSLRTPHYLGLWQSTELFPKYARETTPGSVRARLRRSANAGADVRLTASITAPRSSAARTRRRRRGSDRGCRRSSDTRRSAAESER